MKELASQPLLLPPPPPLLHSPPHPYGPVRLRQALTFRPQHPIKLIPKIQTVAIMTRLEANKLLLSRDEYWLSRARFRFLKEDMGVFDDEFEDEYDVIRELEDAEEDENWGWE